MNDAAMTFFRSRGYTGTYNDAFRKYLVDLTGDTTGTIDDLLSKVLSSYSGSIADKILSFGRDKNYLGTFNDVVTQIWLGGGFQWAFASLDLNFAGATALDPRITFTRASTAMFVNSSGVLTSAANDVPRLDHDPVTFQPRGLLIEEQRTNSIRNNTMQGAVAGTPGTLPTNWSLTATGLTQQVVGVGTEGGISYIDIKLSGTTGSTRALIRLEPTTAISASIGQTWTYSNYVSLAAGSLSNLSSVELVLRENNVSGSELAAYTEAIVPTTAGLASQRRILTRTLSNASAAFVMPIIYLNYASGAAIDVTLRIGMPQLELGAFATSVIPTFGTAATRAADVAVITGTNFSSWYRADEGTVFVDSQQIAEVAGGFRRIVSLNDGGTSNETSILWGGSKLYSAIVAGGALQADIGYFGPLQTARQKTAVAYGLNDFAFTANALAVQTDQAGTAPIVNRLQIGAPGSYNGHIRRIAFFPRRLSNAELQSLTA